MPARWFNPPGQPALGISSPDIAHDPTVKKITLAVVTTALLAGSAYAVTKCMFCKGTGWNGQFKCAYCHGTGGI